MREREKRERGKFCNFGAVVCASNEILLIGTDMKELCMTSPPPSLHPCLLAITGEQTKFCSRLLCDTKNKSPSPSNYTGSVFHSFSVSLSLCRLQMMLKPRSLWLHVRSVKEWWKHTRVEVIHRKGERRGAVMEDIHHFKNSSMDGVLASKRNPFSFIFQTILSMKLRVRKKIYINNN